MPSSSIFPRCHSSRMCAKPKKRSKPSKRSILPSLWRERSATLEPGLKFMKRLPTCRGYRGGYLGSGRGQHARDAKEHGAGTNTEAVGYPENRPDQECGASAAYPAWRIGNRRRRFAEGNRRGDQYYPRQHRTAGCMETWLG